MNATSRLEHAADSPATFETLDLLLSELDESRLPRGRLSAGPELPRGRLNAEPELPRGRPSAEPEPEARGAAEARPAARAGRGAPRRSRRASAAVPHSYEDHGSSCADSDD